MRSTLALATLLVRHWVRAAVPNRLRRDRGRRASAGLLRVTYFVMTSAWGYAVGHLISRETALENRLRGGAWIIVGALGLAVTWSALTRGPTLRGVPSPLEASFLDALPIRESSRLVVGLLERIFIYALGTFALAGAFPDHPVRALLGATLLSTAGIFVGEAAMRVLRIVVPAMLIARLRSYILIFGQSVFLMCVVQAPALARSQHLHAVVSGWPTLVSRAIAFGGTRYILLLGATLAVGASALGAVVLAERLGYDKVDLVPTGRPRRMAAEVLVIDRIDDVLRRREPGGRWGTSFMTVYTAGLTALIVAISWTSKRLTAEDAHSVVTGTCAFAGVMAFIVVSQRASRMATRDVAARPLLAPLPIEPRALLAGKASRLRRAALYIVVPTLGLLGTSWPLSSHLETAWRILALAVASVLAADAAAAIAFLTVGAGSKKGPGGSFVVESVLILVPLLGVATAPYAWAVIVPLASLALVAREVTRSGLGCVRWLDDADDFERETPIWRALLVLAAFQSAQALTARVVDLSELEAGTRVAIAYAVSAAVLVALTLHSRREAPRMRAVPERPAWLLAGVAAGLASGAIALGYLRGLRSFDVHLPDVATSSSAKIASVLMAIVLAPVAEEIFFRGWLLPCIEDEIQPSRRAWLTPLVSAFAFAATHPPISFVPVFVLGFLASLLFLRTRSVVPGILAHLVHNTVTVAVAVASWI